MFDGDCLFVLRIFLSLEKINLWFFFAVSAVFFTFGNMSEAFLLQANVTQLCVRKTTFKGGAKQNFAQGIEVKVIYFPYLKS